MLDIGVLEESSDVDVIFLQNGCVSRVREVRLVSRDE